MRARRSVFRWLIAGAVLLGAFAAWRYAFAPLEQAQSELRISIERGGGLRGIAASLERQGLQVSFPALWLATRLRGDVTRLKAGTYLVTAPTTLRVLLDRIVAGDVLMAEIRFIEGWTFAQMREVIDTHPDLRHDSAGLPEAELLGKIGVNAPGAEGQFLPETYRFASGTSDLDIYRQAHRELRRTLDEAWQARAPGLPYARPYDALIMASIVEKETGIEADRDKVAAVFVNRLRIGMRLQSDPTTIYGLGARFDGNLRKADLLADTPYNTYTRAGLTPTPIALPGRASISAALHPASISALYFVARGDGHSEFSDNLEAHNRAVARYQLKQR